MNPSRVLEAHREAIRRIVAENHALNPRVFDSVLRGIDREDSDLDLLVDSTPDTSLFDLAGIELELEHLLNVKVAVFTVGELPERLRVSVIAEARPV
jgi:predicted nucleotidyltransferase